MNPTQFITIIQLYSNKTRSTNVVVITYGSFLHNTMRRHHEEVAFIPMILVDFDHGCNMLFRLQLYQIHDRYPFRSQAGSRYLIHLETEDTTFVRKE